MSIAYDTERHHRTVLAHEGNLSEPLTLIERQIIRNMVLDMERREEQLAYQDREECSERAYQALRAQGDDVPVCDAVAAFDAIWDELWGAEYERPF